jgi:hypothetical protein
MPAITPTERRVFLKYAEEIQNSDLTPEARKLHFKEKYNTFATKFPVLFEKCCEPDLDFGMLKYMMNMLSQDQHAASVEVGKKLFDIYVTPKIGVSSSNLTYEKQ